MDGRKVGGKNSGLLGLKACTQWSEVQLVASYECVL